jgi:hypothetical protein
MILAATIAYSDHAFVRQGVENFYRSASRSEFDKHALFDPGFPYPNKAENKERLWELCKDYSLEYISIENKGCHQNFQQAANAFGLDEGDIFITACPDIKVTKGWITAGCDVLKADPGCFTVQMNHFLLVAPPVHRKMVLGGQNIMQFPQLCGWSTGMFNMGLVNLIGGFQADSAQYGFIEHAMSRKLGELGKRWYLLQDYYDEVQRNPCEVYVEWKLRSAQKVTCDSFEVWLEKRIALADHTSGFHGGR